MRRLPVALCALALAAAPLCGANDGIGQVAIGGIVFGKTDAIAMKKEVLNVSHRKISVDYEFVNETANEVTETIVFPLPPYPTVRQSSDSYYGQPPNFSILVDGKPVRFDTEVRALGGAGDVTAQLKKAGLSDAQIAYGPVFKKKQPELELTAKQEALLTKWKLMDHESGDSFGRAWQPQINYVWRQTFPPGQTVRVHHEYRPFVAAGPGYSFLPPGFSKDYCGDEEFSRGFEKLAQRDQYVNVHLVSYILKTGNTWKNGIEDFTLNVVKGRPEELISLCFPGKFKKIDAKTYQVHLRNFKPAQDLEVYFGNVADSSDDAVGVMPTIRVK